MLIFPDSNVETEYTDPNGSVWEFNGTGWVRQCESSGGDGGDFHWPLPSKPESEILCLGHNTRTDGSNYEVDMYDVNDATGELTLRHRLLSTLANNGKVHFAHQRKLLGVKDNRDIKVYSYETNPPVLVDTIATGVAIDDFCWGPTDEMIIVSNTTGRFRAYRETSLGGNNWSENLYSPDTTVYGSRVYSISICPWIGDGRTAFFVAAQNASAVNTAKNLALIKAEKSAITVVSEETTQYQGVAGEPYEISSHPYVGGAVWAGKIRAGKNAGSLYVMPDRDEISNAHFTSVSITGNRNASNPVVSPSGNYVAFQSNHTSTAANCRIYRLTHNGLLTPIAEIPDLQVGRAQWTSDEKYLYVWCSPISAPSGEQGMIRCFKFNDGSPELAGVPDVFLGDKPEGTTNPFMFDRCRV